MGWLVGNSFFVVILLLCVGMHLFHGHGHGSHDGGDLDDGRHDQHKHD